MIDTTSYPQLLIFKRHWALSVTVALTILAIVVPVALGMPEVYRASTTVAVEHQVSSGSIQSTGLELRLQMIKQEALSRTNLRELADKFDLYPEVRQKASVEAVIDRIQHDIGITPQYVPTGNGNQATLSFRLSFLGDEPDKVAAVANELASFYQRRNDDMRSAQASKAVQDLEQQMKDAKQKFDDQTSRLQTFLTQNASRLPEQFANKNAALAKVNADLGLETTMIAGLQNTRSQLEEKLSGGQSQTATLTVDSGPQQQLDRAKRELQALIDQGQKPTFPERRDKQDEVDRLQAAVDRLPARATGPTPGPATTARDLFQQRLDGTNAEITKRQQHLSELQAQSQQLIAEIQAIPARLPELDNLTREVGMARDLYESYKRQYEQAAMAERVEFDQNSDQFHVTDRAQPPTEAAGPNRISLIIGGFIGALIAGLGIAFGLDQLDTSFHTLDELRTFTRVPILASIPQMTSRAQRVRRLVMTLATAVALVVGLSVMSYGLYHYAQRHAGLTRLVTK